MGRLMQGESAVDPRAVSKKGAQGLFQLMPAVQDDYGVTDPFDPAQNVPAGMQYYRDLLKKYGGKHDLALAAWNAGPGAGEAIWRHSAVSGDARIDWQGLGSRGAASRGRCRRLAHHSCGRLGTVRRLRFLPSLSRVNARPSPHQPSGATSLASPVSRIPRQRRRLLRLVSPHNDPHRLRRASWAPPRRHRPN